MHPLAAAIALHNVLAPGLMAHHPKSLLSHEAADMAGIGHQGLLAVIFVMVLILSPLFLYWAFGGGQK